MTDRIPREEVVKWLDRLDKKLSSVEPTGDAGEKALLNAEAYRDDSKHWLKQENLYLAFEACVYSWAIVETAENLGALI